MMTELTSYILSAQRSRDRVATAASGEAFGGAVRDSGRGAAGRSRVTGAFGAARLAGNGASSRTSPVSQKQRANNF